MRRLFAMGLGVMAAAAGAAWAAEIPDTTLWYTIVDDQGAQIGHASQAITATASGRERVDMQQIDVAEDKGRTVNMIWRTVMTADASGRVTSISSYAQAGRNSARIDARIRSDRADITRTSTWGQRKLSVPLPGGVRFDNGDELLAEWNAKTSRVVFPNFNVDGMAVERVVIEAAPAAASDPAGRRVVVRKQYDGDRLVGVARIVLDAQGRAVDTYQPMFGTGMSVRLADKAAALATHRPFKIYPGVTMKSPFRIPSPTAPSHIRYGFSFQEGLAFEIPETGEQRVKLENGIATVDVCGDCGPGLPPEEATRALKPTFWVESDSPRVHAIVAAIAKRNISDTEKMEMLVVATKHYMGKIDNTGHYTAVEALSRRRGDCTEAAVILTAFARAAGIPAVVASGVVYSQTRYHGISNAFMPHSWVIALVDGKWRSFDAPLDKFDMTHIVFTIGDGDERSILAARQLSGLVKWEAMSEIRKPPA
jgi:hypothetical protein